MTLPVMFQQKVTAKIGFKISYYSVDMVGIVLCIVVFNDNSRPLYAVIIWPAQHWLGVTCPGKPEIIQAGRLYFFYMSQTQPAQEVWG